MAKRSQMHVPLYTGKPKTARERRAEYDSGREHSAARGYGRRWKRARESFLNQYPLCVRCHNAGVLVAATEVDHITPHCGDMDLFWDVSNWQPLCKHCHSVKTAEETHNAH